MVVVLFSGLVPGRGSCCRSVVFELAVAAGVVRGVVEIEPVREGVAERVQDATENTGMRVQTHRGKKKKPRTKI